MKYPGVESPRVLWQRRQWRLLLLLIDRLPQNSHTHAALADDLEYAEMVLEARERAEASGVDVKTGPSAATWSAEVEMLAAVLDRLAVLVVQNSGSKNPPPRYPRPRNAFERAENRRRQKAHVSLVSQVLPGRGE